MGEPVKTSRPYVSRVRADTARRRRRAVLASAHRLLVADGYARATLPRIAAGAGVSVELLHKTFGDKPSLVRELVDVTLGGDDEPIAMRDRPEVRAMVAEPRAEVVLSLYARLAAATNARAGPLLLAVAAAAPSDPRLAPVWEQVQDQRLRGAEAVVGDVAGKAPLVVTAAKARDVVWTGTSPEVHRMLVVDRGWSSQAYADHLATTWRATLLG